MPRVHVQRVLNSSAKIKQAWSERPTFGMGPLKLDAFNAAHADVIEVDRLIAAKRHELRALLTSRSNKTRTLQNLNTRALSAFRAAFGPDSAEYDQAGGTRRSKHRRRKAVTAAATKTKPARE
jgi:hypothetical protein